MSNIKLFWLKEENNAKLFEELRGVERGLDPELRTLLESNLYPLMGIRVLASNYPLHNNQEERIPTLGLDENARPCIVHYGSGTLALNQGLFYLNWLMDHKADFTLQVLLQMGNDASSAIQWHMPRLICLSEHVASYALHTAAQSAVAVDLIRYRFHSANLLLLERMHPPWRPEDLSAETLLRLNRLLQGSEAALQRLYLTLQQTIFGLCDDVELVLRDKLVIFRRLRNVAVVQVEERHLALYLNLHANQLSLEELAPDFISDVQQRAPQGAGRIEVLLQRAEQLTHILPLLQRSVEGG
ncbi:MAG: DUF5655 domain-containing protein [Symbiobacteriaceae bacterium]|nr:DUF5655 domain-containing protein [Symbiobacteriaceae bacterium]